ncbi:DNA-directed RNA polymerase I subunit RPA1, partial [Lecanoromycetidae sp. Uapishka_2]
MNISQPVASNIGSVEFGFLSSEDIKTLSVKRVQNPLTFDELLHPVPGGLYDAALGAWSDNPHLRLPPIEVNRFICKLRLIEHGLVWEVEELENIHLSSKQRGEHAMDVGGESEESEEEDAETLKHRRNDFVKRAIKEKGGRKIRDAIALEKVESVSEVRRGIIREFLATITKIKTCGSCKGVSPGFRKDRYSKIFRKPLNKKDKAKMIQGGFKAVNPLVRAANERQAAQKQKREDREIDEGIVIESDEITSEGEGEDIDMLDNIDEDAPTAILEESAALKPTKMKVRDEPPDEYVNAQEVHASISELFHKERELMELVYNHRATKNAKPISADMFFIRDILVPPNKYRPEAKKGEEEITEALENHLYQDILKQCEQINQIRKEMSGSAPDTQFKRRDFRDLQNAWVRLQDAVNSMIDSDRNPQQGVAAKQNADGIKQKLEKKEGLFRKNMMGKRVNFAARSVISPDPNIETNEIGVPPVFAKKLTYPEPVTNHNFYELKEAVLNGVDKWPGAAAIENENGQVINLRTKNFEERQALANQLLAPSNTVVTGARNKRVHRHLNNGDIVLMNRQPTLHKPSIMAHRARVLPGEKTIRMHYANCNTYNADFDGDEMNMHFPQNEIARAEALQIADTDHQYLAATAGKPLRGLIQDHISMGLWLTNRDTFFDREDYYQLLYGCLRPEDGQTISDRIEIVPPAMLKPRALWTGKQVITTVLKNITPVTHPGLTLLGRSQTPGERWAEKSEEDNVLFRDGELLCGILDKAQLGPSGGGLIHAVYQAYGHTIAGKLLSILGRLLTKLLNMRAFSCGVADLLLTESGERNRLEKLQGANTIGLEVAAKYVTLEKTVDANDKELRSRLREVLRDEEKQVGLDQVCNTQTAQLSSDITKVCLPKGLQKPFPQNQMQAMTTSGAKGSSVNANFISCNLGQQVLEGRRVPVMVSGKTLPSFKPFETKVRAGGYITDRFLTGVKPQEYFFHAMAGREGLIDTAVKTSRSGYLQRCLIKGMEGLKSEYDSSVRDSDGSMVQFLYGEDGLDVMKQKNLTDFKFLAENYLSLVAQLNIKEEFSKLPDKGADEYQKAAMKKVKKTGRIDALDPCLSVFNPGSSLGSTSESFTSALKDYCEKNPEYLLKDKKKAPDAAISKKTFAALVNIKYMKSVIEPGEAVGVVAGQSVGEPSTQMTLNTFHLAGHSAKNVTLGIPRLREIVMTASTHMSTPTMTLHPIPELGAEAGQKFAKGITKLTIAEVIDNVDVSESIGAGMGYERAKIYKVRLDLFPAAEYCEIYAIRVADILRTLEAKFIPLLAKAIKKELTKRGDAKLLKVSASQPEVGKSSGVVQDAPARGEADLEGGEDDEDDDGDDDATNSKQKQNRAEAISYAEPDDEEEAIARDAQRKSSPELEEPEDEGFGGSPRASQGDIDSQTNDNDEEDEEKQFRSSMARERESRIKEKTPSVTRFTFDDQSSQWCEIQFEYDITTAKLLLLPLVEKACHDSVIQSIPGLQACTFTTEKAYDPVVNEEIDVPVVLTQGVNLRAMHDYQHILNPHRIFTNDIAAMLTHYGVEACRATIIREMDSVFKGHSISVDMRHLNLIADVMTRGGGFTPFNRNGLKSSVSPFMKMSFETTLGFLKDAVLEADFDTLENPSARIVMGKVGRVGTGAFDVLMPVRS